MKDTNHISKPKTKKPNRHLLAEQKKLDLMIANNPQLKTLIDKLDLVLIKNL
jgi:hypothetical protein